MNSGPEGAPVAQPAAGPFIDVPAAAPVNAPTQAPVAPAPVAQPVAQAQVAQAPVAQPAAQPVAQAPVAHAPATVETAGVSIEYMAPRPPAVTAEQFIREAVNIVEQARPMPLSTSVMINRDELMTLLASALDAVPDETRQARWLLRERDELMAKARVDANLVIDEARSRVAQMVQRTEVVRTAERRARQLLDDAQARTRRLRHEVDEYCERQLAQFEGAVDQVQIAVQAARRKVGRRVAAPVLPPSHQHPQQAATAPERSGSRSGSAAQAETGEMRPPEARASIARPPDTKTILFDQDRE